jgi:hypothetical protein
MQAREERHKNLMHRLNMNNLRNSLNNNPVYEDARDEPVGGYGGRMEKDGEFHSLAILLAQVQHYMVQ